MGDANIYRISHSFTVGHPPDYRARRYAPDPLSSIVERDNTTRIEQTIRIVPVGT